MANQLFIGLLLLTLVIVGVGLYGVRVKVIPLWGLLVAPIVALSSYYFFAFMW